jgi:hypothetical protein
MSITAFFVACIAVLFQTLVPLNSHHLIVTLDALHSAYTSVHQTKSPFSIVHTHLFTVITVQSFLNSIFQFHFIVIIQSLTVNIELFQVIV